MSASLERRYIVAALQVLELAYHGVVLELAVVTLGELDEPVGTV